MVAEAGSTLIAAAQWAGRHALPLYAALLAGLLGAVAAGWWAMPRQGPSAARRGSVIGVAALAALGVIAIAGGIAWAAGALPTRLEIGRADQALTDAIGASVGGVALRAFALVTHLADTAVLTAFGIAGTLALALRGRRDLAFGWAAALGGNAVLNRTLKHLFARVRPLHDDALAVAAEGYSFPSGHSSGAVVLFGMLAVVGLRLLPVRWHLPLLLGAAALAFSVGASRVMLRVHFATDVLAGIASGAAWLALCAAALAWSRRRRPGPAGR